MKILVTGGSGFIGSAVCRHLVTDLGCAVVNADKHDLCGDRGIDSGDRRFAALFLP